MTTRNVLLVSYHFPPFGGSGVQRAAKLARYLPEFGWNVHVLTAGHRHFPLMDDTLSGELPSTVSVHRANGFEPGAIAARCCGHTSATAIPSGGRTPGLEDRLYWRLDRFCARLPLPEPEVLWIPSAVRAARRLIREHEIDAVVTTSPPHSIQRIGRLLQKRIGIPWIADLRDPILDNFAYGEPNPLADRFWRSLERTIAMRSSRLVVTCPELADRLQSRYPRADPHRMRIVTNGYDENDRPAIAPAPPKPNGRFVLGYVGSFYQAQSIEPLLEAARSLIGRRHDLVGKLNVLISGSVSARQRKLVRNSDDAFLTLEGYVSHKQAVSRVASADALFLMTPADPGGRYCIPAKVFEYLAFGKHIVALVHRDTGLERILAEAGNVTLVRHGQAGALAAAIESSYDAWIEGDLNRPRDMKIVQNYGRRNLARRLAEILEDCLEPAGAVSTEHLGVAAWEPA